MSRSITTEETGRLFEFCKKHYVQHYDLQVELVDHLASAIEEQWQEKPELQFEDALQLSFKKFGIYGFSKIKDQKLTELSRKYNIILRKYLFQFFTWPKILLTAALTLTLATIFRLVENDVWILVTIFAGLTLFMFYYYFFIYPKNFKTAKVDGKKFLLLEQLKRGQQISFFAMQLAIQSPNLSRYFVKSPLQNNFGVYTISFFIVLFVLALFGEMFYVPSKIKQHFIEQFPEFAL